MTDTHSPTFAEAEFRKAARSEPYKSCVRVARRDGWVELRDDKVAFGSAQDHRLLLTDAAFDTAQHAWRHGYLDGGPVELIPGDDDDVVMRLAESAGPELRFTHAETDAFLHGVTRHEFDAAAYAATDVIMEVREVRALVPARADHRRTSCPQERQR